MTKSDQTNIYTEEPIDPTMTLHIRRIDEHIYALSIPETWWDGEFAFDDEGFLCNVTAQHIQNLPPFLWVHQRIKCKWILDAARNLQIGWRITMQQKKIDHKV